MSGFQKATKFASRLRMALVGPSGSGKTYTALKIGSAFGRVALIDTERGSASKYADIFDFDVLELASFHPQEYINAIHEAEKAEYDLLIVDSLTHAWSGKDGALELVDRAAKRSQSGNSYTAWREVTPLHNQLVDALVQCRCHLITTMRSKVEYIIETDSRGKQVPRRVGMAPIQREGMEYEHDIFGELDQNNTLLIQKSRCSGLTNAVIEKPDEKIAEVLKAWLTGAPAPELPEKPLVMAPKPANGNGGAHVSTGVSVITENQRRRLFKLCSNAKVDPNDFRVYLQMVQGLEHTSDITSATYDRLCHEIEDGTVASWLLDQRVEDLNEPLTEGEVDKLASAETRAEV